MSSFSVLFVGIPSGVAQGTLSDSPLPFENVAKPEVSDGIPLLSAPPPLNFEDGDTPLLPETYVLGAGDRVVVDVLSSASVFDQPSEQVVLVDGTLTLPWIDKVNVVGLTLLEAENKILSAYSQYLNEPRITFRLLQPRPIRVSITGEVERGGSYILPVNLESRENFNPAEVRDRHWPTLTDAISTAGGITRIADVRAIEISRVGQSTTVEANLWELLQSGDLGQDPLLRDGDRISISPVESVNNAESVALAATTFSPTSITVNVVGEVSAPGSLSVPPNTPLNQALLAAGGFNSRAQSRKVDLVRLNPDGSVSQRSIAIDMTKGPNDDDNPVLQPGDTVVVARSGLAVTSDAAGLIFSPLTNLLLNIFGNN